MNNPFAITDTREVYKNRWMTVREDKVIRPGGQPGIFGVVQMVAGASVLPVTEKDTVWLVREYKYAIERPSLEVISGGVDGDEAPLECAKRELQEEAGLIAARWDDLGRLDPFTTVIRSPNHMFIARGLTVVDATPDPGEHLELVELTFSEAIELVMRGEITHGASCTTILKAARIFGL
jgi:8-oxo-dGTP pyrophosphatase MutT (NUDIX family)